MSPGEPPLFERRKNPRMRDRITELEARYRRAIRLVLSGLVVLALTQLIVFAVVLGQIEQLDDVQTEQTERRLADNRREAEHRREERASRRESIVTACEFRNGQNLGIRRAIKLFDLPRDFRLRFNEHFPIERDCQGYAARMLQAG